MQPQPIIEAVETPTPEPVRSNPNGNQEYSMPPRREVPPLKPDDDFVKESLALLLQAMADDREDKRNDRAVTQALLAKLANGKDGAGVKFQAWAPTLIVLVVMGFNSAGWFPKQESSLQTLNSQMSTITQRLNDEIAQREKLATWNEKMRNNLSAIGIIIDPVTADITIAAPARIRR